MGLLSYIRNVVRNMAGLTITPEVVEVKSEVLDRQVLWRNMYLNKAPWLRKNVKSLNLAATIAAEVSRLITLEVKSKVDSPVIDKVYQREIMKGLRNQVEFGLALGGLVIKPYLFNGILRVDFAQPSDFVVINSGSDGTILEIQFKDYLKYKKAVYVRIEWHTFEELTGNYWIRNRIFRSDDKGTIGQEIHDYKFIEPWANIEPELQLINIKAPLFGYFKPAISNNIDTKSPLGISIYSRAVEAIERADTQMSSMVREFKVKEAKQYVSSLAVKGIDKPLPYLEDDYYIKLNMGGSSKNLNEEFFESYSPDIYVEKYLQGLDEYKREIEDCIGLARGTISTPEEVAKTATEIQTSKQRTYVLVTENQKNLQEALEGAVYAMTVWEQYPAVPTSCVVTTEFDDSMISDWESELKGMQDDVASGLIRPEIYIAKKYGVTEEEALKMMPTSEQLLK